MLSISPPRVFLFVTGLLFGFLTPAPATEVFEDTTRAESGVFYQGETATREIRLTASNGFFTSGGFQAIGETEAPADERHLIRQYFTALVPKGTDGPASARWHVWSETDQELRATLRFQLSPDTPATDWQLTIGDYQVKDFKVRASGSVAPQILVFRHLSIVAGKTTITLKRIAGSGAPEITGIDLRLDQPARLLRTRWRPAAVHTRYSASTCPVAKLWVFETESLLPESSYSPMTTEFGYFGAGFGADGRPAGNVNFSMWAASAKSKSAPPLDSVPHLLATGNPEAEFSGFGHEGSGVKMRNWSPYLHHPQSVIQALRVETIGNRNFFYGYLFDERARKWVLFAVGSKPIAKGKPIESLRLSSFCEIPGPAARQRSGDTERIMKRRGWVLDENRNWHSVDTQHFRTDGNPESKQIGTTADGWLTMATGGMEFVKPPGEVRLDNPSPRPDYLGANHLAELFSLPVEFESKSVTDVTASSATINYQLADAGLNARAILYYGETDCFTAVQRDLHGTEHKGVSSQLLANDRTWTHRTESQAVINDAVEWALADLKQGKRYFFRLFVSNDRGKSWDFSSGSLSTAINQEN